MFMKKMTTIVSLVLMSSTVLAHPIKPFLGTYSTPSGVAFHGYKEEGCKEEKGQFEMYDEETGEGTCYHSAENTISISQNEQGENLVSIEVVWGPGNQRDFSGVVTKVTKDTLSVKEAFVDDEGSVGADSEDSCVLSVKIEKNTATLELGEQCDYDLDRASGAVKK